MRVGRWMVLSSAATLLALAGGGLGFDVPSDFASLRPARKASVEKEVRQFAASVARDVTQEGPVAWEKHFADDPAFFMAVDGKLQFPDRQAAKEGTEAFARITTHIELIWGEDLRVDPLTAGFAQMAASWHEVVVDNNAHRMEEMGFFTGLVEKREGQWQFRNAHWSLAAPTSKAP